MSILSIIIRKTRDHFEIVICGLILSLLLFRDPFSLRTQIANFAPAPDSYYYIVPARSLVKGLGAVMNREGRSFSPIVPPLYSFVLAPIFAVNSDPRMFYFMNVVLSFISFGLFTVLVAMLFPKSRALRFLLLFLFVTGKVVYWFPTLAMAENLLIPLYLGGLILLFSKPSPKKALAMGVVAVALYCTKYVSLPLTTSFIVLYAVKLFLQYRLSRDFWRQLFLLLLTAEIVFLVFGIYSKYVLGLEDFFNPVNQVLNALAIRPVLQNVPEISIPSTHAKPFLWFSSSYISQNLPFYFKAVTGQGMLILWEWTPLLLRGTAILGWVGLILAFLGKKKFEAISLVTLIVSQIFMLLMFYSPDGRYVIHIIPSLILGLGFMFEWIRNQNRKLFLIGLLVFSIAVIVSSASRLKKDVMLNLRYAETPWWYVAVMELDKTIDSESVKNTFSKQPYVITPLYPFLVDFFSSGNFALLPMSSDQEFRGYKQAVWGDFDYDHLETEYLRLISNGHPLFIASYGIGHEQSLINAFSYLQKAFRLEEISSACYDQCKIYRVWPTGKSLNPESLK